MKETRYLFAITNQSSAQSDVRFLGFSGVEYQFLYDRSRGYHLLRVNRREDGPKQFYIPKEDFNQLAHDIFAGPEIGTGMLGNKGIFIVVPLIEEVDVPDPEPVRVETNVNVSVGAAAESGSAEESDMTKGQLVDLAVQYLDIPKYKLQRMKKAELEAKLTEVAKEQAQQQAEAISRN